MKLVVAGAGAFGTGLAIALARRGDVTLWARDPVHARAMIETRENARYLPGCRLPEALTLSSDPACFTTADVILLCVPTQRLAGFLQDHGPDIQAGVLVACCKGIDLATGKGPADVIAARSSASVAVLTGPSFAHDIAVGLPTALTLACTDPDLAERLQTLLTRPTLRLYRTTDVTGAQLGGALKNVMAIAAGATIGSGLGESARAAVITRGYAEMRKFAALSGAEPETLMGLSGLGDLLLTCTSAGSRNYSFGMALGRNETYDPNKTVEGMHTAAAVARIAEADGLDLPISRAVDDLAQGRATVAEALRTLLARPLKEE
jgi:glycerol-3-phosphate dehydrogenase (NAD(P)+)